jgi:hypothetical protein
MLIGATLLGLAAAACARVPSHFAVPQLAVADRAFIPTTEAYTVAPVGGGNAVDVLLNGDQIFPAQLAAMRSARETITYAQNFYEEGPSAARSRRRSPIAAGRGFGRTSCWTASGPSRCRRSIGTR